MGKTCKKPPRCYVPKRYIVALMGFLGSVNTYAMRVNLSVAMVAMVNTTSDSNNNDNHSRHSEECPMPEQDYQVNRTVETKGPRYDWSPEMQGWVLSSFFFGYFVMTLAGGYLAERFGAVRLFGGGILFTGILTLLTPLVVGWGVGFLMAVRALEGLGEGVVYPAVTAIISRWSPSMERSVITSFIFSGSQMGNVITMSVSGWLCSTDLLGGWPSVFYVFGTFSCVWFVVWSWLIYETPDKHPTISQAEFELFHDSGRVQTQKFAVPWRAIFTSIPFWAVTAASTGYNFGMFMFLTELPTYISTVHHFDIHQVGYLAALPYITLCCGIWLSSYLADRIRRSRRIGVTAIRKLFQSLGGYGACLFVLAVTFSGCRPSLAVALFCLALFVKGAMLAGFKVTTVDMCPDFAGTVFGITNGVSSLSGILGPSMVGYFTEDGYTIANWNKGFYVTAFIYFATTTFFAVFASADLQPWGRAETAKSPSGEKKTSQTDISDDIYVIECKTSL